MRNFSATILSFFLFVSFQALGQNKPCKFDEKTFQFVGSPLEQARCLLRPNKIGGFLDDELKKLPKSLERIIGRHISLKKDAMRQYLIANKLSESDLGGSLDEPLAFAKMPGGQQIEALYFLIHDTSSPYLKDQSFPDNFNTDKNWSGNNFEIWIKSPVAHIFVNRLGDSITTTPFAEPVRKGFGTKFARDFLKADAKGLQIHIELIQPRKREEKNSNPENDLIAPTPGFTDKQYERLALLYVCTALRRGSWLIPAYHSAIDAGIKDAHDDPQNFDLKKFAEKIKELIKMLKE